MLHPPKSLSVKITLAHQFLLQQLRSKSSRRYDFRDHQDIDGDKIRFPRTKQREGEGEGEGEGRIHLLKSRGQHILTNPRVLDAIVRKSQIKPTDTVLEIGPGTGNLTLKLLQASQKVVAVEIDKRMVEILDTRAAQNGLDDRLTVICSDALKTEFPRFDLVVANIPYGISSPLVAKLVFGTSPFRSATLLLQKEFARRLLANPGDSEFNRLAVNVKLVADVEFIMDVSKRDFVPCPKVDSSVIKIWPKAEIPNVDLQEWWAFMRTCFTRKNKTLGATFKQRKKVMELYKLSVITGCSEEKDGNCCIGDSFRHDEGDEDEKEEGGCFEGGCSSFSCLGMEMNLFREKIIGVVKSSGFEDKRPSKMSHEEFLHLLSSFNGAGIWFHNHAKPGMEPM
ncbi:ribosomal RNA adenine dimethylase family protein [Actinidia rufa]|uniref:rRNA adenine N(6)-methyltransferase n=1 Tax=Actinidia rufa TaxID=165716 RepID=A0A7J0ENA1_9ERIC|nr:ribosomal RNA adenine dimethylase family protein [Actinidia rufa]